MAAECIVVRCAGGRIKAHRLLNFVNSAAHSLNGRLHFVGEVDGRSFIGRRNIFFVLRIAGNPALAIKGGVLKVHSQICRLILVVTPTIENVFRVAVNVDEVTNRILIENPDGVFCLWLRHRRRSDVDVVIARI